MKNKLEASMKNIEKTGVSKNNLRRAKKTVEIYHLNEKF